MIQFINDLKKIYRALPVFGPLPFTVKKEFRYVYSQIYFCKSHKYNKILRKCMFLPILVCWYFKASMSISRELKINAFEVRKFYNIGYIKQLTGICYLAFIKNSPPYLYYYLRLYENKIKVGENYLTDDHFIPILSFLIHGKDIDILTDKHQFWQHFKPAIPEVINILAVLKDDCIKYVNQNYNLPEADLFVKPLTGHGGIGCQKIYYKLNGCYSFTSDGIQYNEENLISLLKHQSIKSPTILQPFLQNHDKVTVLSNGNLATCRINTYLDFNKKVSYLFAIFMMPVDDSVTSNGNGIHSLVNIETGVLSNAIEMNNPFIPIELHPQGGGIISGTVLPYWDQALDLCRRSHNLLPDLPIIAWDIALTPTGAILIEGNLIWPVGFWSILHLKELECQRFISLLEGYLKEYKNLESCINQ